MKNTKLQQIKEQEDRLSKLQERQKQSSAEVDQLKQEFLSLQQSMHETEKSIKTHSEQRQRLLDYGGDEAKIAHFTAEINKFETEGFELLEKIEENEQRREEIKGFLSGLQKTAAEIGEEVQEEIHQHQQSIQQLDLRMSSLQDELPAEFQQALAKALTKKLAHGPFTRIEQGSCLMCRYKISRVEESEIDMQKKLKLCPQCSRIFIPYGT